jgi:hypothetical protein
MKVPTQPIDWPAVARATDLDAARLEDTWTHILRWTTRLAKPLLGMRIETSAEGWDRVRWNPRRFVDYLNPEERAFLTERRVEIREVARTIVAQLDAEDTQERQRKAHAAIPTPAIRVFGVLVDEEDVEAGLSALGDGVYEDYIGGTGYTKEDAYAIAARRLRQVLSMGGLEGQLRIARHEHTLDQQRQSRKDHSRGTSQGFPE